MPAALHADEADAVLACDVDRLVHRTWSDDQAQTVVTIHQCSRSRYAIDLYAGPGLGNPAFKTFAVHRGTHHPVRPDPTHVSRYERMSRGLGILSQSDLVQRRGLGRRT